MNFQRTLSSPIKSVQRGAATIPISSSSLNVAVASVVPGKSFLRFSFRGMTGAGSAIDIMQVMGKLNTATQLVFTRATASVSYVAYVEWELIEYV